MDEKMAQERIETIRRVDEVYHKIGQFAQPQTCTTCFLLQEIARRDDAIAKKTVFV